MAVYQFRTYTQSNGPESFEAGQAAIDVFKIPVAELLATFPSLTTSDDVWIRNKSGLRQYVPELCSVYSDATVTAGAGTLAVDGAVANAIVPIASMASGPTRSTASAVASYTYALNNVTPDGGSAVLIRFSTLPTGTGNIVVTLATRPAQA